MSGSSWSRSIRSGRSLKKIEEVFWEAARGSRVEEVKEIMRTHPSLNVNWRNTEIAGWTALNCACYEGRDSIVAILLAHPAIDVNLKSHFGGTPFLNSCLRHTDSCARLLLQDPRVDLDEPEEDGNRPRWYASATILKWWIVSGRQLKWGYCFTTDREALLERFRDDPVGTRVAVSVEFGLHADLFAMVIFVADGLLRITQGTESTSPAARFFRIANRLPLDLQMVLCHRVIGSAKDNIADGEREAAFRRLAIAPPLRSR